MFKEVDEDGDGAISFRYSSDLPGDQDHDQGGGRGRRIYFVGYLRLWSCTLDGIRSTFFDCFLGLNLKKFCKLS